MFTLVQLESFVAVAEERHFGAAAARLNMTQPPLSRQIQQLERALGARLFDRSARRVQLTAAGEALLPEARRLLDASHRTELEIAAVARGRRGLLRIGYTVVAAQAVLPQLLARLREQLPEVRVSLREAVSAEQARLLEQGEIDLAVLRLPAPLEHAATRRLPGDRLVAVLPLDHPLAGRERVSLEELAEDELIMFSAVDAAYFHDLVRRVLAAEGVAPRVGQNATQVQAVLAFVAGGLGVGLVPAASAAWAAGRVAIAELQLSPGAAELNRVEHHLAWLGEAPAPLVRQALAVLAGVGEGSAS